jgi:hypothetical protein
VSSVSIRSKIEDSLKVNVDMGEEEEKAPVAPADEDHCLGNEFGVEGPEDEEVKSPLFLKRMELN